MGADVTGPEPADAKFVETLRFLDDEEVAGVTISRLTKQTMRVQLELLRVRTDQLGWSAPSISARYGATDRVRRPADRDQPLRACSTQQRTRWWLGARAATAIVLQAALISRGDRRPPTALVAG